MSHLPIELGVLDARHVHALGLHLLALDEPDRHARFGQSLGDEALLAWVHRIPWQRDRWMGAWAGPENHLVGAIQLVRTRRPGVWELALSVAAPVRRHAVATRLLAAALGDTALADCRSLLCHHGHPALRRMARHLGLACVESGAAPGLLIHRLGGGLG
ncbi:GNAT family N-acetyltransferase [Roseateles sp.]|jgi:GNAT superfamily N-acetyltransferase|uniref:GNAT family N-acetyltransferase n=1 Tax=Roseateles sp. TaxID=1971397 RepID=UPI00391A140A